LDKKGAMDHPHLSTQSERQLCPAMSAGEAALLILQNLFRAMLDNEKGVLSTGDPEFLHNFRVAVRRTRSAMNQLQGVLAPPAQVQFRQEFAWLSEITGPTRDLDVFLLRFEEYRSILPEKFRDDLDPLVRFLEAHQRIERHRLAVELASPRYRQLKKDWTIFLFECCVEENPPAAGRPVLEVAGHRIRKDLRRVIRTGQAIKDDSSPEVLHDLRKNCRKLRYLLEFFQSLYPPQKIARKISSLKILQDNLGEYQDLEVQSVALQEFAGQMAAEGEVPPLSLLAMGMLIEGLRCRQRQAREKFANRFAEVFQGKNRWLLPGPKPSSKEQKMAGCLKGKSENKLKEGVYSCEKCGALSKKKGHLCKPEKLSSKEVKKIEKKAQGTD
jgi:CHAD domain-containing protein